MTGPILTQLEVTNFRSIRGHIHAPLDAKVVLIHGENGAGKTSLLSAIELGLTGSVLSLRRADPDYATQLLHRSAEAGSVEVAISGLDRRRTFSTGLTPSGIKTSSTLLAGEASFFSERTYLPQSLLGQLLQIYQDSGSGIDSPLARFVSDLLGLDRLDALEGGLKPLADVRNVRKVVEGWAQAEIDKSRIDQLLEDQRSARKNVQASLEKAISQINELSTQFELPARASEETLDSFAADLGSQDDEAAFVVVADSVRRLASMRREAETDLLGKAAESDRASTADQSNVAYLDWEKKNGSRVAILRHKIEALLPETPMPSGLVSFGEEAIRHLRSELEQIVGRAARGRTDAERHGKAGDELALARLQLKTIDDEVAHIAADAGSLGAALAELTSFIVDDICAVCDRDYRELAGGSLAEHVHTKVRRLSASSERLLTLGRFRGEQQIQVEHLEREIEALNVRMMDSKDIANLDRKMANIEASIREADAVREILHEGARLLEADVAARRAFSDDQSSNRARLAARESLTEFAISHGRMGPTESETLEAAFERLNVSLSQENDRLNARLITRRKILDLIAVCVAAMGQCKEIDQVISSQTIAWAKIDGALQRSQALRDQGLKIRSTVDVVRSNIIRREFNEKLNRLWRDLFVRLAPSEPFVPAFRVPASSTQRLQPKLITMHRGGGDAGGTPGAMLSAGNLNTAALTLFVALHLSVTAKLPWLILDDPVQSMDDVHIAHFAAVLRTLSKEHGRQVVIAVHDRQLFEYLKLELSPAYENDSLLTLELSRGARRDTLCIAERFSYQEETSLLLAV